jgi:hypothetical protein
MRVRRQAEFGQKLPDPLEGQTQGLLVGGERGVGHLRIWGFNRVFDDGQTAMLSDGSQAGGAIVTHAGENHPNRSLTVSPRKRLKKRVGSRAREVDLRALIEPNPSRSYPHVMIRWRNIDEAGFDVSATSAMYGEEPTDPVQNGRKLTRMIADVARHKK